jgi:hypothetical protein
MGLPYRVGAAPGASDDEDDEGDVPLLEEELIELTIFIASPVPISLRGIDLFATPGSALGAGAESVDSADSRDSSSLGFGSCDG